MMVTSQLLPLLWLALLHELSLSRTSPSGPPSLAHDSGDLDDWLKATMMRTTPVSDGGGSDDDDKARWFLLACSMDSSGGSIRPCR
ncbi:hypothetical protein HN51_069159, partial [Arachis hypogaea]